MINHRRIANYVALPLLLAATWLGLNWPWGLVFIWWAWPSIRAGEAFLVDVVSLEEDPILFWAVTTLWVLFGVLMVAVDLFPTFYPSWLT